MSERGEVSLVQRRSDYLQAVRRAERASEAYVDGRAAGAIPEAVVEEMDGAQAALRRAKRRLEETERRLAKRSAAA
jgi:hypothetical protein